MDKKIRSALVSVYSKEGLEPIVRELHKQGVIIYSTGGTYDFIRAKNIPVQTVESVSTYPSILGGRVKTLHPSIFGGILYRRDHPQDLEQIKTYNIPPIDLVIVDLYPFEKTVQSGAGEEEIIEKIDIGGISLLRAGAKNFQDVCILPSVSYYDEFLQAFREGQGVLSLFTRERFACYAFHVSSHYDSAIFEYFNRKQKIDVLKISKEGSCRLRYGENPHQKACFYGDLNASFEQLHGKEISYNNLLDIEAAISLIDEFDQYTFAIIKHNNACGLAQRQTPEQAWKDALAGDPVSAFGGVLVCNFTVSASCAELINTLFFEVLIAPAFEKEALSILTCKKNRILLHRKAAKEESHTYRSLLNGVLYQQKDKINYIEERIENKSIKQADPKIKEDLLFANKIVKHSKSNAIVLVKNKQLLASGVGQTSRVDALEQAIAKAGHFSFDLLDSVMASDAFFPFPDCVEIAHKAGVCAVIHPGGSLNDQSSIDYCNENNMIMLCTGIRHFKH